MNGQDQPLNQGEPSPASFGATGFGGEAITPAASAWNPAAIPTPGPIESQAPITEPMAPIPTPVPAPSMTAPVPFVSGAVPPVTTPMAPIPSPFMAPVPVAPMVAPTPVAPSFGVTPEVQTFTAPTFTPPAAPIPVAPTPTVTPMSAPAPISTPAPAAPAPQMAEIPTITPRSFEVPTAPVAQATPPAFAAPSAMPVPPPPQAASTIDLRTMASDVSSLQSTGGAEAIPQSFTPEAFTADTSAIFSPAEVATAQAEKPKGKTGKILLIAGSVVLVFAIGIGAYFFLAGRSGAPVPESPEVVAPPTAEVPPLVALVPSATPPVESAPVSEQPPRSHSSFFSVAADAVEQKVIPAVSLEEIKKSFYAPKEGAIAPADGFMKEIVLTKSGAGFVNFSEFLNVFLPELSQDSVKALFNDDFTSFVYQDRTNSMMGLVASVKPEASPEAVTAFASSFEASKNVGSFYATDPGTPATAWKGGFVSGKPVQYLAFPKVGYAFDYGWFKDQNGRTYLVISASYAGMREAVRRAGL